MIDYDKIFGAGSNQRAQEVYERERLFFHEAERRLLGALIVNNDDFGEIAGLRAEHFQTELHRRLFEVALQLNRANKIASVVTIKNIFDSIKKADSPIEDNGLSVAKYLADCAANSSPYCVSKSLASLIKSYARARQARA